MKKTTILFSFAAVLVITSAWCASQGTIFYGTSLLDGTLIATTHGTHDGPMPGTPLVVSRQNLDGIGTHAVVRLEVTSDTPGNKFGGCQAWQGSIAAGEVVQWAGICVSQDGPPDAETSRPRFVFFLNRIESDISSVQGMLWDHEGIKLYPANVWPLQNTASPNVIIGNDGIIRAQGFDFLGPAP